MTSTRKAPGSSRAAQSIPAAQARRALLVDDEEDTRALYAAILRGAGYAVFEATNGVDGLARVLDEQPEIVIMDLCMPRMSGWDAARQLKTDPRTRDIPLVILTAIGWERRSIQVPCDAYLLKPCQPVDLLDVVDALLAQVAGRSEARMRAAPPSAPATRDVHRRGRRPRE